MSKSIFENPNSQYDPGLIVKEVHDFYGQAIRTTDARSVVSSHYSHFRVVYDGVNNPIEVTYYQGTSAQRTTFNAVAAGPALEGTYFTVRSAPDNQIWAIWFNLDGASAQPVVANANYIEVVVNTGDSAELVALAITLAINYLHKENFQATRNASNIEIATVGFGLVDASTAGTSPFTLTQVLGTQELVQKIEIAYSGTDPIFEGQVLKGYYYDIYEGKFLRSAATDIQNLTVNVDLNAFTNTGPDNVLVVGSEDGTETGIKHALKIDNQNDAAVHDARVNNTLDNIQIVLDNVLIASEAKLDGFSTLTPDSTQQTGSINGQLTGQKYGVVYNVRQQILASHDREQDIEYQDFGTKDQRITAVVYTSPTFPGIIATKNINYVLDGNRYKRTSIIWNIT